MIKTVLLVADIHIRTFKRHEEYREQFQKFYERVKIEKPDRIVIAGDLVHQKIQMTPELIELVAEFIIECSKLTTKVIILVGNHDFLANNHERLDAITPIVNSLNLDNVIYFKRSGVFEDENVVWVPISLYDDNQIIDFDPKNKEDGKTYIGLFHSPVTGTKTDLGFEFSDIYSQNNFIGLDYVLCGDIHKRQVLREKNPTIIMVGSLIQQNYGETVTKHGYCFIDLETGGYNFKDIDNDYAFYQFKISSIDDIEKDGERLTNE